MSSKRRSPDGRKDLRTRSGGGSSKLRMDSRPQQPRITDPSVPAGRKREIDTVMKKARSSPHSNGYWDKKLLEVEAKDPNRWRHSGYKQLYIGGSSSPSPPRQRRRSRSSSHTRTRSRSRSFRRSPARARPRSPIPTRRMSPAASRRQSPAPRRPRSPSSVSSCSDDSCSVCEPTTRRGSRRSRSRSYSVPRSRNKPRGPSKPTPPRSHQPVKSRSGRRLLISPPSPSPRRTGKDPRRQPPPRMRPVPHPVDVIDLSPPSRTLDPREKKKKKERRNKEKVGEVLLTRIKTEQRPKKANRRQSPTVAESSGSEDSSSSSLSAVVASTRLTLSERFGKMAQWSVDRRDMENMRITKNSNSGDLKVMIEQEHRLYDSPPLRYSHSPAPIGHYPDELMASGPSGLAAWDDVRVRYQYYKDLGYLRDLTLDDYIKWEQWWYKYQEWLKNERYYEHWLESQNHRRRKRLPATQRLN